MMWSQDELNDIAELMQERIGHLIPDGTQIGVMGETREKELKVTLMLDGLKDASRVVIDVVLDFAAAGLSGDDGKYLALDAMDNLAFEWLEAVAEGESPRGNGSWQTREFQGAVVRTRVERSYPRLDAMADAILEGKHT